jgi:hypothetical protein
MNELLNDSQWNSLRISILAFEKRLREAQGWLDGREEQGTFYRRRLSISQKNRQLARQEIERALQELAALGARLELPFDDESVNRELRGEFTVSSAASAMCTRNWLMSSSRASNNSPGSQTCWLRSSAKHIRRIHDVKDRYCARPRNT